MLKLAGIIRESIVDGPGIRFVVFAQGCPHHCPGCHNPQTWAFEGGSETEPEKIIAEMAKNPLLAGVTLSGGEPFCQSEEFERLAALVHKAGKNVVTFTGYTFERLLEKADAEPGILALLRETDILIDGPFIAELKSYDLNFKGSANQRVIDVQRSLSEKKVTLADI